MSISGHLFRSVWLSVLFVACAQPHGDVASKSGARSDPSGSPRIINGNEVTNRNDVPWMVLVICDFAFGPWQCGGSLISDQWVLTSGYCVTFFEERASSCKINVGGLTGSLCATVDEPDEVQYKSIKIVAHPKFEDSEETRRYDIALIKLNQTVTRSSKIQPVTLPSADSIYTDQTVTMVGWGSTEDNEASSIVRTTQVTVRDDNTCDWAWNCPDEGVNTTFYIPATNMCYGGTGTSGDCWVLSSFVSLVSSLFGRGGDTSRDFTPSAGTKYNRNRKSKMNGVDDSVASLRRSARQEYDCWLDTPSVGTKLSLELVNWIEQETASRSAREDDAQLPGSHLAGTGAARDGAASDPAAPRIINGNEVTKREDFPWMAYLLCDFPAFGVYPCDGTLINDQWVLTSAVCISYPADTLVSSVRVFLGGLTGDRCTSVDEPDEVEFTSIELMTHPKFVDYETRRYDVGLVKMNATVTRSPKIQPIRLPSTDSDYTGLAVTILGWGGTEFGGPSTTLRSMEGSVQTDCFCDWMWNCPDEANNVTYYWPSTGLCFAGNGSTGTCGLDEGSPIMSGSVGAFTLIGVVSKMRLNYEPSGSSGCPSRAGVSPTCTNAVGSSTTSASSTSPAAYPAAQAAADQDAGTTYGLFGRSGNKMSKRELVPSAGAVDDGEDSFSEISNDEESFAYVHRSPRQEYDCWVDTPTLGTKLTLEILEWINQKAV